MPTYISLLNFTDEGIRTVKETVQLAAGAAELAHRKDSRRWLCRC
jgi:uncharacterized protein with GYD domain